MKRIQRWSTPASAASFVVTGGSGLLLLFHVGDDLLLGLHEVAGVGMVLAVLVHVVRFWKPLLAYGRNGISLQVSFLVAALATAALVTTAALGLDASTGQILRSRLEQAPITDLAPIFDESPEDLVARLQRAGLQGVTPEANAAQIAAASGKRRHEVLGLLAGP